MALSQELYTEQVNKKRQHKVFKVGEKVYLSTRNLTLDAQPDFNHGG